MLSQLSRPPVTTDGGEGFEDVSSPGFMKPATTPKAPLSGPQMEVESKGVSPQSTESWPTGWFGDASAPQPARRTLTGFDEQGRLPVGVDMPVKSVEFVDEKPIGTLKLDWMSPFAL
jgi:hypothetical protein